MSIHSPLQTLRHLILALLLCTTAFAAEPPSIENGIGVGEPKVFDNRTLALMLEALSENLRNISVVDQKTLGEALKLVQGYQSRDFSSGLEIKAAPVPSLKVESTEKTGNATATGAELRDTTEVKTTQDRAATSPALPTLGTAPTAAGYAPAYGEHASDLLNDQINLSYQIFNLRMLLDRALSDRLTSDQKPRLQAVIGFNVSLDPPQIAQDAVAVVEITLRSTARPVHPVSVVSLLPQEKTYNTAALSTKSNAFGGTAVVNAIQIGYNQRSQSQTFYLYRDSDTISYQRTASDGSDGTVFGWMFRPVLGRRSVSPGLRQMFAIVALPAEDATGGGAAHPLEAEVRTYWKRYDRSTLTSYLPAEANRRTRFLEAITLGLTRPLILDERYTGRAKFPLPVETTRVYQEKLQPEPQEIVWRPVGTKTALVTVRGNNFFTGTQVAMADKIYATPADGLALKSSQAFDFTVPLDALGASPGAVLGRYGGAVPLEAANPELRRIYAGLSISEGSSFGPALTGVRAVSLRLRLERQTGVSPYAVPPFPTPLAHAVRQIIVTVNGTALAPPYALASGKNGPNYDEVVIQTSVPDSLLRNGSAVIRVLWPFMPPGWTASTFIPDLSADFQITRLSKTSVLLRTTENDGFKGDWRVVIGSAPPLPLTPDPKQVLRIGDHTVRLTVESGIDDRIILIQPNNATLLLDVPKAAAEKPAEPKPPTVNQHASVWLPLDVKDATKVAYVEANGQKLQHIVVPAARPDEVPKTIKVLLTADLTAKARDLDLAVTMRESSAVSLTRIVVLPQPEPTEEKK